MPGPGADTPDGLGETSRPDPAAFRVADNWHGGYYELAIELAPGDDAQLQAVLDAVWSAADVRGCFAQRDREPHEQDRVPRTVAALAEAYALRGQVRLPTGQLVVCLCLVVRGDPDAVVGGEDGDWLSFCVPYGALSHAGVPFADERLSIRSAALDDWLAGIARKAFETAPFRFGVVGWEVACVADPATLRGEFPRQVGVGYLVPRGGVLRYVPAGE
ncbi:hypothetical protein [Yinghuangia soli]|uniref:Uncharacterized protein n=1 Tax=Yinghuangia soli TaxID=2908204 RepID=A0AA41PZH8_9ACTN|nr:hypothetical protein [Yinghuangia soli]MCF2527307.1 hypothetical protein [Yinghuangia soli]